VLPPAIVIGSGVVSLGVINDLTIDGIPVVHVSPKKEDLALRSRWAIEKVVLQPQPDQSRQLLKVLMDPARRWDGACLIPTTDPMIRTISQNLEILRNRFVTPVQPWSRLLPVIDKTKLYGVAEKVGVATPRILLSNNFRHAEEWCDDVGYPVIVKPAQTPEFFQVFGVKVLEAHNKTELSQNLSLVKKHHLDVMVSEIIPGDVLDLKSYRSYTEYGVGLVQQTIPVIDSLQENAERLLEALGFRGFSNMEFKHDSRDKTYKLIEINPRPVLAQRLFRKAGINFAKLTYLDAMGIPLADNYAYKNDVISINNTADLYHIRRYAKRGFSGLRQFIAPYFAPQKVFLVPPLRDPAPYFYELKRMIAGKLRRRRTGKADD